MARKRIGRETRPQGEDTEALSRREFFTSGAAAGVSATVLAGGGAALAQTSAANSIKWDYEADIVVLGAGATGLVAAIRAKDLGASVLVIDQNFDAGGKMTHSGGWVSLGGGDAIQERDRVGADPERMGLTPPRHQPQNLADDPDRLFIDMTDWSVVNSGGMPTYRLNDREVQRAHADNCVATRQLMLDNYVRFARIEGTHQGGGMTRARGARSILKLADVTDIKAGTVSRQDAGSEADERNSLFNSCQDPGLSAANIGAPGWIQGGFALARCLEFSAREKGIRFMMHRHMDEIIREQQFSGRVLGVKASYSPRLNPQSGERLEGYWQNGNIEEKREHIYIRARQAVIIGTGGMIGNKQLRTMMDPRWTEDSVQYGDSLLGKLNNDGSGIIAAMRIGANLAGMMLNNKHHRGSPRIDSVVGTRDRRDALYPGHPAFLFAKARGIAIGDAGWEHVCAVNQVGQRFYNELAFPRSRSGDAKFPPGSDGTRKDFTPLDWRNCSVEQIKSQYRRTDAVDAALAMNEGSQPPDYSSGPSWAIFDQAAVDRGGWELRFPFIANPPDGSFFKADTLEELARNVTENEFQRMPLKYLVKTIARYNELAASGKDTDFDKPRLHRINTPPFYAAIIPIGTNDSYGGIRINGKGQVIDLYGKVVEGLYAGGEASGNGEQHGLGRATVHGYIAGTNAVKESRT